MLTLPRFMVDPTEFVYRAPSYTKVRFATNGSRVVTGLVRDMPKMDGRLFCDRRITVLDTGFEFFVNDDTVFDFFEFVEFDGRG